MSKVVISLPKGMVKNSLAGGVIALAAYVGLQGLWALLLHNELLGMEQLYPLVCTAAAVASFLGCGYSLLKGKEAPVLSISVVVVVFLTLTLAAAFVTTDAIAVENGLTGIGLSMAAGGLASAVAGARLSRRKGKTGRGRARKRRRP